MPGDWWSCSQWVIKHFGEHGKTVKEVKVVELLKLSWAGLCWLFVAGFRMTSPSYREPSATEVPENGSHDECSMGRCENDPVDDHVRWRSLNDLFRGSSVRIYPDARCDVPNGERMVGCEGEMPKITF